MRTAVALTGLLQILTVSTSCAARSRPVPPSNSGPVTHKTTTQTAAPTAPNTPAPTLPPAPTVTQAPAPLSPNVALHGTVSVDYCEEWAQYAIDGDPETFWRSQVHPAQWISVTLDDLYIAERIELVVAQAPAGPTTHVLWLDNGSDVRTRLKQLTDIHTKDGQTVTIEINPPRTVKGLLVQTLEGPSWVAWREVRIFGLPFSAEDESGNAPQLRLDKILDQLVLPVQVTHAGDGSGRIFFVEQHGRIRIAKNGTANETLFLDISNRVGCCEERGLFNVAFPPSFPVGKQFYLSDTDLDGDTVISRFKTTANHDVAAPGSEEIVLSVSQPHEAPTGGRLVFGPLDGYLYLGIGDGGTEGFPAHSPQDPQLLLNRNLRFDVESGADSYTIPPTNPFIGEDRFRDEIWALDLRSPWGIALDGRTGERQIVLTLSASLPVSSVGEDEDGNLYVTGYADGAVYTITLR